MVLTERCARKILDMDIRDLTKGMINVLEVSNEDLCERLFLEICSNGWEFPIARVYCANKDKYSVTRPLLEHPAYLWNDTFGLGPSEKDDRSYHDVNTFSKPIYLSEVECELCKEGLDTDYFDDNGFGNVLPGLHKINQETLEADCIIIICMYFIWNIYKKLNSILSYIDCGFFPYWHTIYEEFILPAFAVTAREDQYSGTTLLEGTRPFSTFHTKNNR